MDVVVSLKSHEALFELSAMATFFAFFAFAAFVGGSAISSAALTFWSELLSFEGDAFGWALSLGLIAC